MSELKIECITIREQDNTFAIPLKEKLDLKAGILLRKDTLNNILLKDTMFKYFKYTQLPLPQILLDCYYFLCFSRMIGFKSSFLTPQCFLLCR